MRKLFLGVITFLAVGTYAQNTAMDFDGVDDFIQTTNPGVSGNGARTIEAWINTTNNTDPTTGNGQSVIVDYGEFALGKRFTFCMLHNSSIRLEVAGGGLSATTSVNDGAWHHVAVTYDPLDNDTVRLFIDGLEAAKSKISVINTGNSIDVRIGQRTDNLKNFVGKIDEVKIWDFAKTEAQLSAGMNAEECSNTATGLVGYFPLNEGVADGTNTSVTTQYDYSTTEGHGTPQNMTLSGTSSNYVVGPVITKGMDMNFTTATSCGDYIWSANNTTYTTSGVYNTVLTNIAGCDSVVTLDLNVLGADNVTETVFACYTYTWPTNNQTYTASGQFSETLTNINGCDSVVTLDLTIGVPSTGTDEISACDSYTWIDGVTYTASNNTATHTLPNYVGCDSVVTLDLTINNSDAITQTVNNCGIYTWPVDGQSYFQSGTYTHTLTNISGCDSVITLDLTIHLDYTITDNISACDSYTWPVNGTTYTASGSHTESFTSTSGCDSTHILNLTLNTSASSTQTEVACATYTWVADGMTYTTTGQYTATLQTVAGCDSVVTLDLTIDNVDNGVSFDYPNGTFVADETSPNATFQWMYCTNMSAIANETSASFTPQANGDYAIEVSNGVCVDTSDCVSINNVGVETVNEDLFNIYPNPNNGSFNILLNGINEGVVRISDAQGRVVYENTFVEMAGINVQLPQVGKGLYTVQVYGKLGNTVKRVVVE